MYKEKFGEVIKRLSDGQCEFLKRSLARKFMSDMLFPFVGSWN